MTRRRYLPDPLAVDEFVALDAGHGCGLCLDFGHLNASGPCQACRSDAFTEYLLDHANAQVAATWAEEHSEYELALDRLGSTDLHADVTDVYGEVA